MFRAALCFAWLAASPAAAQVLDVRELDTRQIAALDRAHTVVLLVGGILEEHGPYLPAGSDGYQSEFVAAKIAEAIAARPGYKVLRFPPLPLGASPANEIGAHYVFPGSYPVRSETLRAVVMDLATDLGEAGFRQVVLVNYHGAPPHNQALDDAARYFSETYGGRMLHVSGLVRFQGAAPRDLFSSDERAREGVSVHADADEHSRLLFLKPELVAHDLASAPPVVAHDFAELQAIAKAPAWTGYFGTPAIATAKAGGRAMNALAQAAVDAVLAGLDGAPVQDWPRVADRAAADPGLGLLMDQLAGHERQVARREADWLFKQRSAAPGSRSIVLVEGPTGDTRSLGSADLEPLSPRDVTVTDPHSKETAHYRGVPLLQVLALVGTPAGDALRGKGLALHVRAEASDGYVAAFSVAELDAGVGTTDALLVYQRDGQPLSPEIGPFRLVVPTDKRAARWVRNLVALKVLD
jgi:creatinine amidohydrolase/Fe(II)-dependent formamide hydrolase-like protein